MHAVMGTGRLIAGRYRLLGPIGRGAMGIVWRGRDELLHRDVAVKEVQISVMTGADDAEAIYQRTLREARAAARLNHPNVVTVFDVVEEDGSPWIVMELVAARSLDQVIAEDGPLPPRHAAELGAGLLGALAAAHAAGVLHRDVKPGNVLVTAQGRAVLTDFGIATFADDPGMTLVGLVVGTPGFTAPERVHGLAATPASDLWSLGATLYAAVEGRGPFDRVGGAAAISAGVAAEEAPRSPSAGPLAPVIDALLRRDPASRPDSATAATLLAEATTGASAAPRLGDSPGLDGTGLGWGARGGRARGEARGPGGAEDGRSQPGPDLEASPDAATTTLPARPGTGQAARPGTGQAAPGPSFLDSPVFADLRMPGLAGSPGPSDPARGWDDADASYIGDPAARLPEFLDDPAGASAGLWPPGGDPDLASAPGAGALAGAGGLAGSAGSAGSAGPGGSAGPPGAAGSGGAAGRLAYREGGSQFEPPPDPGHSGGLSRHWRAATFSAGLAAIVIAALVGFGIYSHSLNDGTASSQSAAGPAAGAAAARGAAPSVAPAAATPTGGAATPAGTAGTAGQGATTSGTASTASGSPSPGGGTGNAASGTTSPSTGTGAGSTGTGGTGTGGSGGTTLPAGFARHSVTAAALGTTAGFTIAAPAKWPLSTEGMTALMDRPNGHAVLEVNLSAFSYALPGHETRYLQAKAIATKEYPGYRLVAIAPTHLLGTAATSWQFTYKPASSARLTVAMILATLPTSAGNQAYALSMSAPSSRFGAASLVFDTALSTFRPLPPA